MQDHVKYFTLDEASRTLPLVERIVKDIVDAYPVFQEQLQTFHDFASSATGPGLKERMDSLRVEIDESAECINGYIRELQQIGCMFKGFEEGLVDFHSTYRGRTILLCWKLGEERIGYWHEMDAGYAGRQPITAEMAEELEATRTAGR